MADTDVNTGLGFTRDDAFVRAWLKCRPQYSRELQMIGDLYFGCGLRGAEVAERLGLKVKSCGGSIGGLKKQINLMVKESEPDNFVPEAWRDSDVVNELTDVQRRALSMKYDSRLDYGAIVAAFGLSGSSVKRILQHAEENLERLYKLKNEEGTSTMLSTQVSVSAAEPYPIPTFLTNTQIDEIIANVLWSLAGRKQGRVRTSIDMITDQAQIVNKTIKHQHIRAALTRLRVRSLIETDDPMSGQYTVGQRLENFIKKLSETEDPYRLPAVQIPVKAETTPPTPAASVPDPEPIIEESKPVSPLDAGTTNVTTTATVNGVVQTELALVTGSNLPETAASDSTISAFINNQLNVLTAASETIALRERNHELNIRIAQLESQQVTITAADCLSLEGLDELLGKLIEISDPNHPYSKLITPIIGDVREGDLKAYQDVVRHVKNHAATK